MRPGTGSSRGRRVWLTGRITVLVAIVVAGTLAIVHYANIGQPLASSPDPPVALTTTDQRPSAAARTVHRTLRTRAALARSPSLFRLSEKTSFLPSKEECFHVYPLRARSVVHSVRRSQWATVSASQRSRYSGDAAGR